MITLREFPFENNQHIARVICTRDSQREYVIFKKKRSWSRPKEKNKYCCLKKRGELRLKMNQDLEVQFDKLIDRHKEQRRRRRHESGFILSTTFCFCRLKKNVFPVTWNFLLIYVDLKFF